MKQSNKGKDQHRAGFVALVGPANAGKSTLLNAILGTKVSIVSAKQQSTRNRVRGIYSTANAQVVFVDTPGFLARRYRGELSQFINRVINQSLAESDRTLLVLDSKMLMAQRGAIQQIGASLKARELTSNFSVVLNKVDQVDSAQLLPLIAELQKEMGGEASSQIEFFPISALKGQGVDVLLESIIKDMPVSPPLFDSNDISDQPEEFFISEIIREKLFGRLHKELPYSIAVIVESLQERSRWLDVEFQQKKYWLAACAKYRK
ncbi:UNVERIFIED_CONTAM: hypothetical protein GTU68_016371 [Idotea baltica]|nr:hypothetical protein [Idotea baltica]